MAEEQKSKELKSDPETIPDQGALSDIIEESKAALAQEEPKPIKRTRGRPKKDKSAESEQQVKTAPIPPNEIDANFTPILKEVVKIPFNLASERTHFKGFRLDNDEAMELAIPTDKLLQKYLPNLGETTSLVAVCLFSFVSVTLAKYTAYQAWLTELRATVVETEPAGVTPQESNHPKIATESYFKSK